MPNPVPPIHRAFTPIGPATGTGEQLVICDPLHPSQGLPLPLPGPAQVHVMHLNRTLEALAITGLLGAEHTLRVADEPPLHLPVTLACVIIGDAALTAKIDLNEPMQDVRLHQGPDGTVLQFGVDFSSYQAPIPSQEGRTMNELLRAHGWTDLLTPTAHLPLGLNRLLTHKTNAYRRGDVTTRDESGLLLVNLGIDDVYEIFRLVTPDGRTGGYLLPCGGFGTQGGLVGHFTDDLPSDIHIQRGPRQLKISTGTDSLTITADHPHVLVSSAQERWAAALHPDTPLIAAALDPTHPAVTLNAGDFVQIGPARFDVTAPARVEHLRDASGPCGLRVTWQVTSHLA